MKKIDREKEKKRLRTVGIPLNVDWMPKILCIYLPKAEYKKLTDFLISAPEILTLCLRLCVIERETETESYPKVRQSADKHQSTQS